MWGVWGVGEHTLSPPLDEPLLIITSFVLPPDEASSYLVNVTPSANYPLDLYFLMDLSYSMKPFVDQLFNLSLNIGDGH